MAAAKLLLVEDDPDMGMLVSHALRGAGYQVTWVKDGVQAMQAAKASPPDLIVSDFMFPAGGGATFFQRLRLSGHTQSTPIVILSAVPKELIAATVGADVNAYYLPKPYKKDEFLGLIADMLKGEASPAFQLHEAPAETSSPGPRPARGTVLIIGEKEEDRALIRGTLERKGFHVAEARDGAETMSVLGLDGGSLSLNTLRPNLIILDAQIDFGSGSMINARLELEPLTHSIRVLVVTPNRALRAAFADATNVAAFIDSPIDPARLLRHVEELFPVKN